MSARPSSPRLPTRPGGALSAPRLAGGARLRAGALVALVLGAGGSAPAWAQAFDGLQPGMWNILRSGSAQPTDRSRGFGLCVDARGAKDPALLVGEAPGDASCRIRTPRRTDPQTVVAELECPDGRRLRAVARFNGPDAFVTRIETLVGRPHEPDPAFIHASRGQTECVR